MCLYDGYVSDEQEVISMSRTSTYSMDHMPQEFQDLYAALREFMLTLGSDVREFSVPSYLGFRRVGRHNVNFAQVRGQLSFPRLRIGIKVKPDTVRLEPGFTYAGPHGGSDQMRVCLGSRDDLRKAQPLFRRSYEASTS